MSKKKISPKTIKVIKEILEKMPADVRKKMIEAHKQGKKIKLNLKKKKEVNSPYQDK